MSFSEDIRSSDNFQKNFRREKRRIQLSEIPKSDIDTMQEHVVEMRTYNHFIDLLNTTDNVSNIQKGPHHYIFEPDYRDVKIRTVFGDPYGLGNYQFQTLNGVDFHALELFDQSGLASSMWHCVATSDTGVLEEIFDTSKLWTYKIGFHPPQLQRGNSVALNLPELDANKQFIRIDVQEDFLFTSEEFSLGFWIYPIELPSSSDNEALVAYRFIDTNNLWTIEIDNADNKLFTIAKVAGVETKRQFGTPLVNDTWYFVCPSWDDTGPSLSLKVNDQVDEASTKSTGVSGSTAAGLYFGSYPGIVAHSDFRGYLTGITYYNNTVLSTSEKTSLYNYNTKSVTTNPFTFGYGQYG